MAILDKLPGGITSELQQDAERFFARWGRHAQECGWAAMKLAGLVRKLRGREVKQLTAAQATVGTKTIYRNQLGA